MAGFWNEEREEQAAKWWLDGCSAQQISDSFKGYVSRSAVLGKMNRLGYLRNNAADPARVVRAKPARPIRSEPRPVDPVKMFGRAPSEPNAQPAEIELRTAVTSPNAKPWTEREFGECAFPVSGGGADTMSCCNLATRSGYCRGHWRIMHDQRPLAPLKASMEGSAKSRFDAVDALPGRKAA